ncbi:MAG: hypothetical protein AAGA64_12545 [Bacteroidota bacterium]
MVSHEANYSTSTRKEVTMAIQDELSSHQIKVMPILLKGSSMPHYLRDKHYADLTKSFEDGVEKITHDIYRIIGIGPGLNTAGTSRTEKTEPSTETIAIGRILLLIISAGIALWVVTVYFYPVLYPQIQKVPIVLIIGGGAVLVYMFKTRLMNLQIKRDANFAEDMGTLHITHVFQKHYRNTLWRHKGKLIAKSIIFFEVMGSLLTVLCIIGFLLFIKDVITWL